MKMKRRTSFESDEGHLLPRPHNAAPIKPAKNEGLAPGQFLGQDPNCTVVMCWSCGVPLMKVYVKQKLGPMSSYQKPTEALVGKTPLTNPELEDCPVCDKPWASFDFSSRLWRYKTNKGIM